MPRRICLCALIGIIALLTIAPAAHGAPSSTRCFPAVPSIGDCLQGRFAQYWASNGGVPVFGYPTTPMFDANTHGAQAQDQMLERNRLEYHPELAPPYDILLGRLGEDLLLTHGRNWRAEPVGTPQAGCWWVATTHHTVCDQASSEGFLSYYRSHGLELGDPGVSERESLALFGYPLTEPRLETNATGDTVLTQWFERARFEWHPELPEPYRVLLGLLGRESWGSAPLPPASQLPAPAPLAAATSVDTTPSAISPSTSPTPATVVATPSAGPSSPPNDDQALTGRMATLVDTLHQQAGCAPFRRDVRLDRAAQSHADDIALHQRIDHIGTDGATLRQRLDRVGYPYGSSASESIGVWTAPEDVVNNWMDEPPDGPHRLNITNCQYTENGFGLGHSSDGRRWWVMDISSQRP